MEGLEESLEIYEKTYKKFLSMIDIYNQDVAHDKMMLKFLKANMLKIISSDFPYIHKLCQGWYEESLYFIFGLYEKRINIQDKYGRTALHYLARVNNIEALQNLIAREDVFLDVNIKDHGGMTPLHFACQSNSIEIVKELMRHSEINLNEQDKAGRTSLYYAISSGSSLIVNILLAADAELLRSYHDYLLEDDITYSLRLAIESNNQDTAMYFLNVINKSKYHIASDVAVELCIYVADLMINLERHKPKIAKKWELVLETLAPTNAEIQERLLLDARDTSPAIEEKVRMILSSLYSRNTTLYNAGDYLKDAEDNTELFLQTQEETIHLLAAEMKIKYSDISKSWLAYENDSIVPE